MNNEHWINRNSPQAVETLLRQSGLYEPGERLVSLHTAGEGNMNVTLRAVSERQSVIVKQSRPFVAKYDFIPAPSERIHFEARFYEFARQHAQLAQQMPGLLAWIPESDILVLEDLGAASDATSLYAAATADQFGRIIPPLVGWLNVLHSESRAIADADRFQNRTLRALNHAHIFEIPFQDPPAIDLDAVCPGLQDASQPIRTDQRVMARCRELGNLYLADGDHLLHGDFYPGSWLLTERGPFVIDPEFCFLGAREFDFGVLLAHLQLSPAGSEAASSIEILAAAGLDLGLTRQFAAVEVLRRLLGVAQLPLTLDLAARTARLQTAFDTLCHD